MLFISLHLISSGHQCELSLYGAFCHVRNFSSRLVSGLFLFLQLRFIFLVFIRGRDASAALLAIFLAPTRIAFIAIEADARTDTDRSKRDDYSIEDLVG